MTCAGRTFDIFLAAERDWRIIFELTTGTHLQFFGLKEYWLFPNYRLDFKSFSLPLI